MASKGLARRTLSIFLFLCVCRHLVTSQDPPQVLPPGDSNVTYSSNINVTVTDAVSREQTTRPVVTVTPRLQSKCTIVSVHHVRDQIEGFLLSGAKIIELELQMQNYPAKFLHDRFPSVFRPSVWVRATGRQGRSLLVLEDNYDFMSLFFLSIGVHTMNVTIKDEPRSCLRDLTEDEAIQIFREVLLNDFKPQDQGDGSLSDHEVLCNLKVKDNDGYADFVYTCCHKSPDGMVVCSDVMNDEWIDLLLTFIFLTKVLVVLYSPSFLPGSLYRLKYTANEYIYKLPKVADTAGPGALGDSQGAYSAARKSINVVVTQYPEQYHEGSKVVKVSQLKDMGEFKKLVTSRMRLDQRYRVSYDNVRLSVKARRLLGENRVPVGLMKMLYVNLLRCRIRRLSPLKACCEADVLQWPPSLAAKPPGTPVRFPWSRCARVFAQLMLLMLIVSPWIVRVFIFFSFEDDMVLAKKEASDERGLQTYFRGSLTLYLTPLHGFFILIYIIVIVDSLIYGIVPDNIKEKLKSVFTKCLRDMRERSKLEVLGWAAWLLLLPFEKLGFVGVLLFPLYLLLVLPFAVPLAAFYLFPFINLSIRLLVHFFLFVCPRRCVDDIERMTERFTTVKEKLKLHDMTGKEHFEKAEKYTKKALGLQIAVVITCLVSFWSVTFLLMEVVSFFVEMCVYTLMGIIVNAGTTLQYITVAFLTLMYGKSTFNEVHDTYLAYHKVIHKQLLTMKREDIDNTARQDEILQDNTGFRVVGDMHDPPKESDVRLIVKDGRPMWKTSSLLMFLDKYDTPYTPEKFFHEVINLRCCGAPGPIYRQFLAAAWSFSRILLFLFFVFVVVMAFGDAYNVSTTNQLLATVVGGFIPFLFRYVFAAAGGHESLQTDSVQFKMQFHEAINKYAQNWSIFDIHPTDFKHVPRGGVRDSVFLPSTEILNDEKHHGTSSTSSGMTTTPPPTGMSTSTTNGMTTSTEMVNVNVPSTSNNHEPDMSRNPDVSEIHDKKADEEGYDPERLDLIIDVSTKETRLGGLAGLREAGSMSMLRGGYGYNFGPQGGSGSARQHRPPSPLLSRSIQV